MPTPRRPQRGTGCIVELETDDGDKHFKGSHDGLRLVSQRVRAAVAIGENLRSIGEFCPFARRIQFDLPNVIVYYMTMTLGHQFAPTR